MKNDILQAFDAYTEKVDAFLEELGKLPDETLNKVPDDGGWTALQTLHHLIISEELGLKYSRKKLQHTTNPEKKTISHAFRSAILKLYLRSPFTFKAPPVVSGEALPEQATHEATVQRWKAIHKDWRAFLESMPDELTDKAVFKHPLAGRLSWVDTIGFFRTHFERHQKQAMRAAGMA